MEEALWQAVQARRTAQAATRSHAGTVTRSAETTPALLAGLAKCARFGGGLTRRSRTHGAPGHRRLGHLYACTNYYNGHRCDNGVELQCEILNTAVLKALARALEPRQIEVAVEEAVEQERAERAGSANRRQALERELALIGARSARLTEAVAAGGVAVAPVPSI